mgnify:CR=1 FL=1
MHPKQGVPGCGHRRDERAFKVRGADVPAHAQGGGGRWAADDPRRAAGGGGVWNLLRRTIPVSAFPKSGRCFVTFYYSTSTRIRLPSRYSSAS